jgi:hypothetical protein
VFEGLWVSPQEALEKLKSFSEYWGEGEFVDRYLNPSKICFTENGISINSDFLNGLETKEAKENLPASS